jgi:hypothetical protein
MPKMIPCRACGEQISDRAQSCPKCGHPTGVKTKAPSGCALVLFALLGVFIWGVWQGQSSPTEADKNAALSETACATNLSCFGNRHMSDATAPCKREIERKAAHEVKWTDGIMTPTFSKFGWADASAHTLRYVGDQVEFQNGFGAMTHMIYFCDYNPASQAVTDVTVVEGRL